MNKRIQNKIAKRIIKKIGAKKPLTEFEIKYSGMSKYLWSRVVNKKDELDKFPGGLDLAEGSDMTAYSVVQIPSVTAVEEPNKWNKLKGKMKGWFGK